MIVVSDTSPILNLAIVGRLDILRTLFQELILPPAVALELERHHIRVEPEWMRIVAVQDLLDVAELRLRIDPGEAEAIVLALELNASLILIDESRGRRVATERGLQSLGLLGVLAEAKARRVIGECRPVLDGMIEHAGFWIGNHLRLRFLMSVGEEP